PDSQYAAVIPLFIEALHRSRQPEVHGDGTQSRDFTYVDNVVDANIRAAEAPASVVDGAVYNVAGGSSHSLLDLLEELSSLMGKRIEPRFTPLRAGDVRHSSADISAAARDLGYEPSTSFAEGLRATVEWFLSNRPVS
ncbi:MAG: GDP-mannose 4,6-dehydratase, partial [Actinomycetota bacterium]|nr:GDP-mannose 4,6-dehydratase [Actinomycetota bacterium]